MFLATFPIFFASLVPTDVREAVDTIDWPKGEKNIKLIQEIVMSVPFSLFYLKWVMR